MERLVIGVGSWGVVLRIVMRVGRIRGMRGGVFVSRSKRVSTLYSQRKVEKATSALCKLCYLQYSQHSDSCLGKDTSCL